MDDFLILCPPECAREETRSLNNLQFHLENALESIKRGEMDAAEWSILQACEAFPERRRCHPPIALKNATRTLLKLVRRFNIADCAPASSVDFSS